MGSVMGSNVLFALSVAGAMSLSAPVAATALDSDTSSVLYVAHLHPLNSKVTGSRASGEARFSITGDSLKITIDAKGLPPRIMHLQHFHGFPNNRDATCATAAADTNRDGIIDLIETGPMSGTTMVPFHDDPVSMKIVNDTYPKASRSGSYHYQKVVSLTALKAAFSKAFNDPELDLDRRVVYIHGIFPATTLPKSVASLGKIPAQITLPIACGKIERLTR
jgi:hypothetical protein